MKELYDPSVTERGVADPVWADRVWAEARALIDDGRHPGKIIPYIPSGEIKVWDNIAGDYIPIEGVMVTIMPPDNLLRVLTRGQIRMVNSECRGRFRSQLIMRFRGIRCIGRSRAAP